MHDELFPRKSWIIQLEMRSNYSRAIDMWNVLSRYLIGSEVQMLYSLTKRFIEIQSETLKTVKHNRIGVN